MEKNDYEKIQKQIGYSFRNLDLLQQAFVRKSYSIENGGQDNEVLEFIGDKVLDFFVVKLLAERYGHITNDSEWLEYENDYSEGKLTEIKKHLVQKSTLAYKIQMMKLEQYLILGKSDRNNNVMESESVQEDLFEAILGAIAIDSNWDMIKISEAIEIMLDPENELEEDYNFVELIQEWTLDDHDETPDYQYMSNYYYIVHPNVISDTSSGKFSCVLTLRNDLPRFRGFGQSKSMARRNACKKAYKYLDEQDLLFSIQDEIENPCREQAIGQLEILARRGYFEIPMYDFSQEYDKNGNPIWRSICRIEGESKKYSAKSSSKKEAKKSAAYKMLNYVLENY